MSFVKNLAIAVAFACSLPAAHATTINFNGLAGTAIAGESGHNYQYTYFYNPNVFTLSGFTFGSQYTGYLIGTAYSGTSTASYNPVNGTDYFLAFNPTIRAANGSTFTVNSLDLGHWSSGTTTSITLVGTRADNSTVTQVATPTMSNNASVNDFLTVSLNNFTGLTSLSITNSDYITLDNLVVNAAAAASNVPEPASLALLGLGVAGLVAARRRKG
jgi:hypothetical protein